MKTRKHFGLQLMLNKAACKMIMLGLVFCLSFSASAIAQTIVDFNAAISGKAVLFNWSLSPDSGFQILQVERSSDQQNYHPCVTIKNVNSRVFAWDKNPKYGKSYYRLKVTSLAGIVSYSQTVMIGYYPGLTVVHGHPADINEGVHNRSGNLTGDEIPGEAQTKTTYWVYDIHAGNKITLFDRAESMTEVKARLSSGRPYLIITLVNDAPAQKEYYLRSY